uniref:Uncharacterized protein n=1 Tax=Catharus ustulatus TaxID=91951 RepID=A0A8C3Y3Q2_CATUS
DFIVKSAIDSETELHKTIKINSICDLTNRASKLTSLHLLAVLRHVVRADGAQEFDVIIAVVLGHLLGVGLVRTHANKFNFLVFPPIVEQQVVGHADPVRFHGVSLAIIIIPNIPCKQRKLLINSAIPGEGSAALSGIYFFTFLAQGFLLQ